MEKSANKPTVCVQGLGFVGLAMAVAVADSRNEKGEPYFNVIGVDLPHPESLKKIDEINKGILPFKNNDTKLSEAFKRVTKEGTLIATSDDTNFSKADVTLVSINLDLAYRDNEPTVDMTNFTKAIKTLGTYMKKDSLIIIETTVPPGTCEKVVVPEVNKALEKRGLPKDAILVAHSYERVMPGDQYLNSIINFWRVFSGHTSAAAEKCEEFLSKVINVKQYPLTRLHSTTASETAKVLENSYRATNIAFIEEWGRFAEQVGIDLFEVISAIRKRPTHNNIRQPGFGVGGYCLTKDPLFAEIAAREFFGLMDMDFTFSKKAIEVNNRMPLVTLDYIKKFFNNDLSNKTILVLGISYRQDVGDTRFSPAQIFVEHATKLGANIIASDPLLTFWPELKQEVYNYIPKLEGVDAVVFAVPHREYNDLNLVQWLKGYSPLVFDANNVLSSERILELKKLGYNVKSIGRGI
jgi:UDP-N-acetyl-D-glucosamine dehydrogenase